MKITEIGKLSADDYEGGETNFGNKMSKLVYDLPGDSGFRYAIVKEGEDVTIKLFDPAGIDPKPSEETLGIANQERHLKAYDAWLLKDARRRWALRQKGKLGVQIGELNLTPYSFPSGNAMEVTTITVHNNYRNMGVAKAMYGVALSVLKVTLVAGNQQTPGGMRNWVSISKVPGAKVRGFLKVQDPTDVYGHDIDEVRLLQTLKKDLKKLDAGYMGSINAAQYHFWAFDVAPNTSGSELAQVAKTKTIRVYNETDWRYEIGLFATWGK